MVFLVALYFAKNGLPFKSREAEKDIQANGLIYSGTTVADLLENDSDQDGVSDWEEALWGLDPQNAETTPGVPDSSTVNKMKIDQEISTGEDNKENLTETDKFSRELLSTVAALSQNGVMDEVTVEKISASLAEQIKNTSPRKVFIMAEIKIVPESGAPDIKKYNDSLSGVYKKYPVEGNVLDILQRFVIGEDEVDTEVLKELEPIIVQMEAREKAILGMEVPTYLAQEHLDLLNAGERILENLADMRLYDTDPVLALGAISQYEKNSDMLMSAIAALTESINKKLRT